MSEKKLEWSLVDRKQVFKTPVFDIFEQKSCSPKNMEGNYVVLDAPDWVLVIPVLENPTRFIMVKQWRHVTLSVSTEFPGGVIDPGEAPEAGARREVLEETGYEIGKLTHLGSFSPNPAIMSNTVHCFLAEELIPTGTQHLDPDEFVEYFTLPEEEVFEKMGSAEFPHGLMVAALQLYRQHKINTKK